jgi:hypothetical protein
LKDGKAMDSDVRCSPEPPVKSRPFQFSLATLFLLLLLASLAGGICFALPEGIAAAVVLFLIPCIPAMLLTCALTGAGYLRTFSIGAMFPTLMTMVVFVALFNGPPLATSQAYMIASEPNAKERTLENWREWAFAMGIASRPAAVASWAAGLLTGLSCIGARWAITRKRS